ncbi:MAG: peptide chain release factor N(5)-glutamine methyltransferase [Prevotellaceae bacterium]|nr:peptide chain release factor N(5)-glutamine methyltransferase [Prevotellaceae bacterium]
MSHSYTVKTLLLLVQQALNSRYSGQEVRSISYLLFEHVLGMPREQVHISLDKLVSNEQQQAIAAAIEELKKMRPIQYILGSTSFFGLELMVNEKVLIPRPETEELVDKIIREAPRQEMNILDIGTGSGCIAIALAKNLSKAHVFAWDISDDALAVAKLNAKNNDVKVTFNRVDVLQKRNMDLNVFDIIVSNPPYVRECEKKGMSDNVLEYEPHSALFVPDKAPLIFYKAIADIAMHSLRVNGSLYLEINESLGNETLEVIRSKGFENASLYCDINGKHRIIHAKNGKRRKDHYAQ